MKDHEIAELINQVRDVSIEFGQTQQLRERLARILAPILQVSANKYNLALSIYDELPEKDKATFKEYVRDTWVHPNTYTQTVKVKDGCISPHWELGTHYSSGYLKYFHKYEGKKVRVTLEFLG